MTPSWWSDRWPYFTPEEVLSPNGLVLFEKGHFPIQANFLDTLHLFRVLIDTPVVINHGGSCRRGFRDSEENGAVGGAGASWHVRGMAADISVPKMTIEEAERYAIESGLFTGIGTYRAHLHVDIGFGPNRRWHKNDS